jgi:hypothetical protein
MIMLRTVRRLLIALSAMSLAIILVPRPAFAGEPHFVDSTVTATRSGDTLTVSGKEAGLGDGLQVHIVVTATALCINNGGNRPKAVNKADLTASDDFPVQTAEPCSRWT